MSEIKKPELLDIVIVGAGFAGLYMLKKARDDLGLSAIVLEAGDDVGGAWYWNRYPGLRCDTPSHLFCYSFDPELTDEWEWSERYPEQKEIYSYLRHVSERYSLRKDIAFESFVSSCVYQDDSQLWKITTSSGDEYLAKYLVSGTGPLSATLMPKIPGIDDFKGRSFHTSRWPKGGVDFTAKKVAVIGTGATGVQCIPQIAIQAKEVTVFQRTPVYCVPARNGKVEEHVIQDQKLRKKEIRDRIKHSFFGFDLNFIEQSIFEATPEERNAEFQRMWDNGGFEFWLGNYKEAIFDERANEICSDFIRDKIRETVLDPVVAEKLVPKYCFGTKRSPLDTNYYETFNKTNVNLVDASTDGPIETITPDGVRAGGVDYDFDVIVYATGFDAVTGSLKKLNIVGRNGLKLNDEWASGPNTYLGLMTAGFPNFFMIAGPQSPAAFSNLPVTIEQHVEYISDCLDYIRTQKLSSMEPTVSAQEDWGVHLQELVDQTLFPKTDSWYLGSNVEGKPRKMLAYLGPEGVGGYRRSLDEIASNGYTGFEFQT